MDSPADPIDCQMRQVLNFWQTDAEEKVELEDFEGAARRLSIHNAMVCTATGADAHWETFE